MVLKLRDMENDQKRKGAKEKQDVKKGGRWKRINDEKEKKNGR